MKVFRSEAPAEGAGISLTRILTDYKTKPILLMVSGGSGFSILEYVSDEVLGPHISLSVLDERFSKNPDVNNLLQLEQTGFFMRAIEKGVKVVQPKITDFDTNLSYSNKFEVILKEWRRNNPEGVIVATMGIGSDGHTAGIFKNFEDTNHEERWVVGYRVSKELNEHTERVTVTYTFLKEQVDRAIVYASGKEKRKFIDLITTSDCKQEYVPSCILQKMRYVELYTDK